MGGEAAKGGKRSAAPRITAALLLSAWLLFPFAAEAQTAAERAPAAEAALGERPEPPRRAASWPERVGETATAVEQAAAEGPKEGLGPLGWFGFAATLAALALLAGGAAGVFDGRRRSGGFSNAAARAGLKSAGSAASKERVEEEDRIRSAPARAAESAPRPTEASPVEAGLKTCAAPRRIMRGEAIGLLALHDELSPRLRRAAAYAYGARNAGPTTGPTRGPTTGPAAERREAPSAPHAGPSDPAPSVDRQNVDRESRKQDAATAPGSLAPRSDIRDAAENVASRSAKIASVIRKFSESKSGRRPARR